MYNTSYVLRVIFASGNLSLLSIGSRIFVFRTYQCVLLSIIVCTHACVPIHTYIHVAGYAYDQLLVVEKVMLSLHTCCGAFIRWGEQNSLRPSSSGKEVLQFLQPRAGFLR